MPRTCHAQKADREWGFGKHVTTSTTSCLEWRLTLRWCPPSLRTLSFQTETTEQCQVPFPGE